MKDKNTSKTGTKSGTVNMKKGSVSPGLKATLIIIISIVSVLIIVGAVILFFYYRDHDVGRTYNGDLRERYDYDLSDYISVPKYNNLEVILGNTDVTKEELQRQVLRDRAALYNDGWNEVRLTEEGDRVNITFSVETEDGQNIISDTKSIVIGNSDISSDVDSLLTGVSKGEHVSGKITVSQNSSVLPQYVGQVMVFSADIDAAYYLSDISADSVVEGANIKFDYKLKESEEEDADIIKDGMSSELIYGEDKGEGLLLGIEEHLGGLARNKSFSVEVTLPDDFENTEYAGKKVILEAKIKEIETWEELLYRGCENGDIVGLEYKILCDGKVVEDNNKSRQNPVIGAEDVLPGIDEALIGLKVGDTFSKEVTLPVPCYSLIKYSGRTVTVEGKVVYIDAPVFTEYNDEWALNFGQESIKDYETLKMTELNSSREKYIDSYIENCIVTEIAEKAEVKKMPEKEWQEVYSRIKSSDEASASADNVSFSDYIKSEYNFTEAEYEDDLKDRVDKIIRNEMVYYYIARRERLALTDEEYEKRVLEYASEYELASVEDYEVYMENYAGYSKYDIHEMIWFDMTYEYLESKIIRK